MDPYFTAVQRALDHIEDQLCEPLALESVARKAGFSLWHFQRIFAALAGEPLGSYIRRRRLTAAAGELRTSSRRILDIALDYQFESHEAFTRAFKSIFTVTPGAFRKNKQLPWINARRPLSSAGLDHLAQLVPMNPQIISLPGLTLLGLETHFIGALSPEANNMIVIPPLYKKFFSRQAEMPPALDGFTYGSCDYPPEGHRSREDELVYLVGSSVAPTSAVPTGMTVWRIPALTYAHFTHRGPISQLSETINYVYGAWLPRSEYERAVGPELERYDERFGDGGEKCELDFLVPITRKIT